jgi:prepilin-type N-terminal cleavage/methylation domain-containing protein
MKTKLSSAGFQTCRAADFQIGIPSAGLETCGTAGLETCATLKIGAFTLIEIMMVVAIIGLTLTMSIPSFHHMLQREGIGKVERDLVEACQKARQAAIMNNQTTDLVIRPLDHTFGVPGAFDTVTIPPEVTINALGVNFIPMETQEEARVHFFPKGTSDEFIIILHGYDGSYRTIYLDVVTALVRAETGAVNPYKK